MLGPYARVPKRSRKRGSTFLLSSIFWDENTNPYEKQRLRISTAEGLKWLMSKSGQASPNGPTIKQGKFSAALCYILSWPFSISKNSYYRRICLSLFGICLPDRLYRTQRRVAWCFLYYLLGASALGGAQPSHGTNSKQTETFVLLFNLLRFVSGL